MRSIIPIPFSDPNDINRQEALTQAYALISRLSTADVIAVLPVLSRHATQSPSPMQYRNLEAYPSPAIVALQHAQARAAEPPAG